MDPFSRIASEGVLLVGGAAAILLQVSHPLVAAGVAEHSDFRRDPVARLRGTLGYVYAQASGDAELAAATTALVARAHAPVRREHSDARPGYSADDPELQFWVVATLYRTADVIARAVLDPLDEAEADAVYAGYARLGTALGMPAERWPSDRAAFQREWTAQLSRLSVGDEARGIARDLLHPERPLLLRPLMPLVRLVTPALLPTGPRREFGLRHGPVRARIVHAGARAMRVLWPRLPRTVRTLPQRIVLRGLRRHLAGRSAPLG
ncbi:oxygenase MpaB family protein [Mycetocola reblochoni]|uniref:ER-bound oxygenase mpaB/mpaB'/Rubber oxygenase catalytic domain-containing protein n=2 Tax=Mycetocola reblochoni TaxID=331618 RepID=A0A1R4KB26_9MICO|nr:oxygenase MpaB family protein [Mycetocola reblochoni]RLP69232.1 DUF2236 domain-containing protein [Mycetocola reblochoni]SJN41509.1 hypothetical protein FM119_12675 [Mycetocola reblochoni REB411]